MNHEMMPGFGDSSDAQRNADNLDARELDPTAPLTAEQINELCFKVIDLAGAEKTPVTYDKNGLYVEAIYSREFNDQGQPYETVYSVIERRIDPTRTDGRYYNSSHYQIALGIGPEAEPTFAEKETYYEVYDERHDDIVRVELDIDATDPEERLKRAVQYNQDKIDLGVDRELTQEDYLRLKQLLALLQR